MNDSEEIFRKRFLPLYPKLYRVAASICGNSADAFDAVQDTMVKIWNRIAELSDISSPLGYSLTILKNASIDIVRRRNSTELPENLISSPQEPDTVAFLHRAIMSLPENQREVIRLSAFGELSSDEIADRLNISSANARQLLSRGRRKLREIFQKNL
ncbi:MAG: RNA polymerase sigma factor [Bacteroides sp.]|nr:RNA polymerase sigma factor [Bacteroides sp.]MCM1379787.1 RNA polymerase sigma factor [Bacteroides sp.]MCM1446146.1 RNA polymerase sigma factor [Prevotella sp.]